ncbi:MAG: 6-carboxytetrahydropterin synthase [Symploca sp. SIO2C1]|nr:6-carboxytetrahydropterin synthase [Symploca sp. SIO2C1]
MHSVTKVIDFCYGHRLLNYSGKCQHLHGHNGIVEIEIESNSLDELGMVVDFGEIRKAVKGWIDSNLDHRMILCRQDPVIEFLVQMGEPLYLMDENPTAENIAKHIYKQVQSQGFKVRKIGLWETPSSYASYEEE